MYFCNQNELDYKHFAKWGGEDFELLICVPEEIYTELDKNMFLKEKMNFV